MDGCCGGSRASGPEGHSGPSASDSKGSGAGWAVAIVLGLLLVVAVGALLLR